MFRLLVILFVTKLYVQTDIFKLTKSVLIPLGLTAAASATDAAIHKKMFGSGARPLDLVNDINNF